MIDRKGESFSPSHIIFLKKNQPEPQNDITRISLQSYLEQRKAISTVIATVILVAVAITVAVGVSYWMGGFNKPANNNVGEGNETLTGTLANKFAYVEDGNTRWFLIVAEPDNAIGQRVVLAKVETLTLEDKVNLFLLELGKPVTLIIDKDGKTVLDIVMNSQVGTILSNFLTYTKRSDIIRN